MGAIVVGGCGDEASDLDAALSGDGIEADKVHCDVLEDGKIMGGVAGSSPHLIVREDDAHAPVEPIFHGPVRPDGSADPGGIGCQAPVVRPPQSVSADSRLPGLLQAVGSLLETYHDQARC